MYQEEEYVYEPRLREDPDRDRVRYRSDVEDIPRPQRAYVEREITPEAEDFYDDAQSLASWSDGDLYGRREVSPIRLRREHEPSTVRVYRVGDVDDRPSHRPASVHRPSRYAEPVRASRHVVIGPRPERARERERERDKKSSRSQNNPDFFREDEEVLRSHRDSRRARPRDNGLVQRSMQPPLRPVDEDDYYYARSQYPPPPAVPPLAPQYIAPSMPYSIPTRNNAPPPNVAYSGPAYPGPVASKYPPPNPAHVYHNPHETVMAHAQPIPIHISSPAGIHTGPQGQEAEQIAKAKAEAEVAANAKAESDRLRLYKSLREDVEESIIKTNTKFQREQAETSARWMKRQEESREEFEDKVRREVDESLVSVAAAQKKTSEKTEAFVMKELDRRRTFENSLQSKLDSTLDDMATLKEKQLAKEAEAQNLKALAEDLMQKSEEALRQARRLNRASTAGSRETRVPAVPSPPPAFPPERKSRTRASNSIRRRRRNASLTSSEKDVSDNSGEIVVIEDEIEPLEHDETAVDDEPRQDGEFVYRKYASRNRETSSTTSSGSGSSIWTHIRGHKEDFRNELRTVREELLDPLLPHQRGPPDGCCNHRPGDDRRSVSSYSEPDEDTVTREENRNTIDESDSNGERRQRGHGIGVQADDATHSQYEQELISTAASSVDNEEEEFDPDDDGYDSAESYTTATDDVAQRIKSIEE